MNLSFDEKMTAIAVTAKALYAELKAAPKDSRRSIVHNTSSEFMRAVYADASAARFLEGFIIATLEEEERHEFAKNTYEAADRAVEAGRRTVQKVNQ